VAALAVFAVRARSSVNSNRGSVGDCSARRRKVSADLKLGSEAQQAIRWFDEPKPIPLDALKQNFIGMVLLTGMVNPFGPTMKGLAVLSNIRRLYRRRPVNFKLSDLL
jgi:hypothetical protein